MDKDETVQEIVSLGDHCIGAYAVLRFGVLTEQVRCDALAF